MKITISPNTSASILSVLDTFEFIKKIEVALTTVDIEELKGAFEKASLLSHTETSDFLLQGTTF